MIVTSNLLPLTCKPWSRFRCNPNHIDPEISVHFCLLGQKQNYIGRPALGKPWLPAASTIALPNDNTAEPSRTQPETTFPYVYFGRQPVAESNRDGNRTQWSHGFPVWCPLDALNSSSCQVSEKEDFNQVWVAFKKHWRSRQSFGLDTRFFLRIHEKFTAEFNTNSLIFFHSLSPHVQAAFWLSLECCHRFVTTTLLHFLKHPGKDIQTLGVNYHAFKFLG